MTRAARIISVFSILALASCQKEVILEPFDYPGLLNNSIDRVEVFDDGTILTLSNEGIYIKEPNSDGNTFKQNAFQLSTYNAYQMRFFHLQSGKIYGVNNEYVMEIDQSGFKFYIDENPGLNGYLTNAGYCLSPNDKLLRLDYSTQQYDSVTNSYGYYLRLSEWDDDTWYSEQTEIFADLYSTSYTPSMVFTNSVAYIVTNKIYEVYFEEIYDIEAEELIPININSDVIMNELSYFDKTIFGFQESVNPYDYYPRNVYNSASFSITSGRFSSENFNNCADSDFGISIDDFLGYSDENAFFFQEESFNWFSSDNIRGSLVRYDMLTGKCNSQDIIAIDDFEEGSLYINDVSIDFNSNILYVATNTGLYKYDLSRNVVTRYLDDIIEVNDNE